MVFCQLQSSGIPFVQIDLIQKKMGNFQVITLDFVTSDI